MTTYEDDVQRPDQRSAFSIETVYLYAFVLGCVSFFLVGLSGLKISLAVTRNLIAMANSRVAPH